VDQIAPNPQQPRRVFDEGELERLASSIRQHGLLQPVVVRKAHPGAAQRYELVVGERRWRASKRAGRETIPATIQDVTPSALLRLALVENVQRADLNPMELAHAFQALIASGASQEEVGEAVGLQRSTVANHLRLLELAPELQGDVEAGALSMGHAKALLQVRRPVARRRLRDRIVAEGLSVRSAEALARRLDESAPAGLRRPGHQPAPADPDLAQLEAQLREHLQTRVRIVSKAGRGRIEIEFYGPEDLHRVSTSLLEGRRP